MVSETEFNSWIAEQLRAIRYDRYNEIDPSSCPPERRGLIEELNKCAADRNRVVTDNEARYQLIINSTPIAICITDEQGYYEYANPEYRRLTGYSESELIGRHFTLVVPEETRDELNSLHQEFMGRRAELEGQWTILHKDGHPITILANAAYIVDTDGRPKKVTYVVDISELTETRRRLEDEIEKRKITEQTRDQVERVMRHDLRNPLDGIQTAAEYLLLDETDSRRRDFIRLMLQAAHHARRQIDSSLAYARMQRGQYALNRSRINLVQLIRDVRDRLERVGAAFDVEILLEYNDDDWSRAYDVELWGEPEFLADAIANLLRNAIEASDRGGCVTLTVRDDHKLPDGGAGVLIVIRNDRDITEEIRDRVFEPYVTAGKTNGTGLGAYTAKLVVDAHGGSIDITTGQGTGTTVSVMLPRARIGEEKTV